MNTAIFIIFTFLSAALAVPALIRQFQMLQQNSYFAVRYLRWYRSAFDVSNILGIAVAAAGAVTVFFRISATAGASGLLLSAVLIAFLAVNAAVSLKLNKKSIKKLVFTARVKRMLTAGCVLFLLLAALAVIFGGKAGKTLSAVLFFISALPELGTLILLLLMKPVEKAVSQYYINDAKKILRQKSDMKIIGVTGSYGKTSTKYIIGRILSEKYNTLITPENYNTPMGIVITVRRDLKPQTEVFVAEMGAKRKGDIAEICDIANPSLGVITSIGPQHLDTFGKIETVVSTKFELADRVRENGGIMFFNTDNIYIKKNSAGYSAVTYGTADCDCRALDISYSPDGLSLDICYKDIRFRVTSKLLGIHNALNITAAAAVALELGLTPQQITFAVSQLKPVEHRLQLKPYIGGSTLIDDAYNSNPEGCLEAVRVLGSFGGMKKIIVTPGLVELGDKEYECNRRLGQEAAEHCDIIILVGKKRSVPLAEGIRSSGKFPEENLYVVSSFAEATGIFSKMCDSKTVILFENDLPDNYLN